MTFKHHHRNIVHTNSTYHICLLSHASFRCLKSYFTIYSLLAIHMFSCNRSHLCDFVRVIPLGMFLLDNVLGGITPRKNSHKIQQFTFCIVFHTAGQMSTERWQWADKHGYVWWTELGRFHAPSSVKLKRLWCALLNSYHTFAINTYDSCTQMVFYGPMQICWTMC